MPEIRRLSNRREKKTDKKGVFKVLEKAEKRSYEAYINKKSLFFISSRKTRDSQLDPVDYK